MGFHNDEQTFVYSYCQNGSARTRKTLMFFLSTKVFKMIHKIRQSSILVDLFTCPAVCPCDCSWSATEHSHFAHIAVFLLHKSEKSRHVRPTKMVARLQSSEQTSLRKSLKMILADVEHRCSKVKLVKELSDEYMHVQHISNIFPLNFPENIDEPFKVAMSWTNPEEVYLFACDTRVTVCGCSKDKVVEDGGVGSHTNASANHNCHLILVPVLVSTAKRTLKSDLWQILFSPLKARTHLAAFFNLFLIEIGVKIVPQSPCPGSNCLDMN